jgi:hypothetical protein
MAAFTEDFTGTNDDPWSSDWTTSSEGSVDSAIDIQSNQGHLYAGTTADDFAAATLLAPDIQDAEVLLLIDPNAIDANNKYLYVCLRSTGEQVAANAGRPVTAYYLRISLLNTSDAAQDLWYRRISDAEVSLGAFTAFTDAAANIDRNANEPFWLRAKIQDSGSTVICSVRMWDADASEPAAWGTDTDTSPGALLGATGTLQLVARNYAGGYYVEPLVDDIWYDELSAGSVETVIRPISDTAATGWDSAPTASQDLFAQVDEVTPSDTDYIYAEDPNP